MGKQTSLYNEHLKADAKIVDFSGWDMPLHYGSQIREHHYVRQDAGMFDVSHMTIVDLSGTQVRDYLRYLVANNVDRLQHQGKALYTCMLNEQGGVIDDLIVYFIAEDAFRIVFNAGTREKALAWAKHHAEPYAVLLTERPDLAMIAIQGPNAREKAHGVLSSNIVASAEKLSPFNALHVDDVFIARTGYTGEDGYELMLPNDAAVQLWQALLEIDVKPVGLGARDTLRLEAGMNLHGTDMDESTTPLVSGLAWTVAWEPKDREFIGRAALETQRLDKSRLRFVGLVLEEKGVLRNHQPVFVDGSVQGEITSGSFAPTLGKSIALARIPRNDGQKYEVEIRGKLKTVKVVKPPFARSGKSCLSNDL